MSDDDEGFTAFLHGAYPRLVRTVYLLCGSWEEAEDIAQEALARTYLARARIRDRGAYEAYARRVAVTQTVSWWRRPARREVLSASMDEPPAPDQIDRIAERDLLMRALLTLPARQRATVVLRYFNDLSEEQTAETMGVSVGTVKSQTARALSMLRTRLTQTKAGQRGVG